MPSRVLFTPSPRHPPRDTKLPSFQALLRPISSTGTRMAVPLPSLRFPPSGNRNHPLLPLLALATLPFSCSLEFPESPLRLPSGNKARPADFPIAPPSTALSRHRQTMLGSSSQLPRATPHSSGRFQTPSPRSPMAMSQRHFLRTPPRTFLPLLPEPSIPAPTSAVATQTQSATQQQSEPP